MRKYLHISESRVILIVLESCIHAKMILEGKARVPIIYKEL